MKVRWRAEVRPAKQGGEEVGGRRDLSRQRGWRQAGRSFTAAALANARPQRGCAGESGPEGGDSSRSMSRLVVVARAGGQRAAAAGRSPTSAAAWMPANRPERRAHERLGPSPEIGAARSAAFRRRAPGRAGRRGWRPVCAAHAAGPATQRPGAIGVSAARPAKTLDEIGWRRRRLAQVGRIIDDRASGSPSKRLCRIGIGVVVADDHRDGSQTATSGTLASRQQPGGCANSRLWRMFEA